MRHLRQICGRPNYVHGLEEGHILSSKCQSKSREGRSIFREKVHKENNRNGVVQVVWQW